MNKNIFKTLIFSFMVLFSALFINIDEAKANCRCYYSGGIEGATNSSGIAITQMTFAQINYTDSNAYVEKSCSATDTSDYTAGTIDIIAQINKCRGIQVRPAYTLKDKVNYKEISQNCSIESCNSANIWFDGHGNKLKIGEGEYKLNAIKEENFNQAIENRDELEDKNAPSKADNDTDKIKEWGDANSEGSYSLDNVGDECGVITSELKDLISTILWIIDIIGILLLIVMTVINFIQAITGSDEEKLRDALKHLRVRVIVVFVLLLLPVIVSVIITIINHNAGGVVEIGADGQPFCNIEK